MSDSNVKIDFQKINVIVPGNILDWKGVPYTVYDTEPAIVYLKTPEDRHLGIPTDHLRPILLSDDVMKLCGFLIDDDPIFTYTSGQIVRSKTMYRLLRNELDVDMTVSIVIDYEWDSNDVFLVRTLNKLDLNSRKLVWLHQMQNLFHDIYGIELVEIS